MQLLQAVTSDLAISAFWGPLSVGLILYGLNLLISRPIHPPTQSKHTLPDVRHKFITIIHRQSPSKTDDNSSIVLVGLVLVVLALFYARNQQAVVLWSGIITFGLLGFWLAAAVSANRQGIVHGTAWAAYLVLVFGLSLGTYLLLSLALSPLYAPPGIENVQTVATEGGLSGIAEVYGLSGIMWLTSQVLGFLFLYAAQLMVLLSLIFYVSAATVVASSVRRPVFLRLARMTATFATPVRNFIFLLLFYALAFILISGYAYHWWQQ